MGMALAPIDQPAHLSALGGLNGGIGNNEYREAWAVGQSMRRADAVSLALSHPLD
jgi:hypothetical protein